VPAVVVTEFPSRAVQSPADTAPAGQATAARRRYQTGFWTYEGSNGLALAGLGPVDEDTLIERLLGVITPPVERLQQIAGQLEETGTLNASTVAQLHQVVDVLTSTPAGPGAGPPQCSGTRPRSSVPAHPEMRRRPSGRPPI
jgi:hypothetical protein